MTLGLWRDDLLTNRHYSFQVNYEMWKHPFIPVLRELSSYHIFAACVLPMEIFIGFSCRHALQVKKQPGKHLIFRVVCWVCFETMFLIEPDTVINYIGTIFKCVKNTVIHLVVDLLL